MASNNIARLGVVLGIDTAEFSAGIDAAILKNRKLGLELKRDTNAAAAEITRLKYATDDYGKTLTQVQLIEREIKEGRYGQIDQKLKDQLRAQAAAYDAVAVSTKKAAGGMTAFQQQSLMYQTTDFFTQVASGQSVMIAAIQQGGQLKDTMGGLGNMFRMLAGFITPATVALSSIAVVAGTAAYGFYAGSKEVHEFNKNLILTGNYAGTTYSQILSLSKGLSDNLNVNLTTSRDAFFAVAASGKFTQESLSSVAESISLISKISGVSAQEAADKLIPAFDGSAASAKRLNDQYHFLTFAQYKQIELLANAGKKQESIKLTTDLLNNSLKSQEENLGAVVKLWNDLANLLSKIKSAILDIGRTEDSTAAVRRLNDEIVKLTAYKNADRRKSQSDEITQAQIDAKREEIRMHQKKIDAAEEQARKAAKAQKQIERDVQGGGIGSEIKKAAENAKLEFEEKIKQREAYANEIQKIEIEAERQAFDARADFEQKQRDEQGSRTALNEENLSLKLTSINIDRLNKIDKYKNSLRVKEAALDDEKLDESIKGQIAALALISDRQIAAYEKFKTEKELLQYDKDRLSLQEQMISATDRELKQAMLQLEVAREIKKINESSLPDSEKAVEMERIREKELMKSLQIDAEDRLSKIKEFTGSVFNNMSSAIDNFVKTGKFAFKDFAASVIRDLIAIQIKAQATSLFNVGLKAIGFGNSMGPLEVAPSLDSSFMQYLAPRAAGGPVASNSPYLVGEVGPELFIPRNAGTIIPNNALASMGGGGQTINYNGPFIQSMSAIDTQSGLQFLAKNKQSVWSAYQSANRGIPMSR